MLISCLHFPRRIYSSRINVYHNLHLTECRVTFQAVVINALKQCSTAKELELGKRILQHLPKLQPETDVAVANTLINMYSKCGDMSSAEEIFDGMELKTVVTWNCLILGYVNKGQYSAALSMFNRIDSDPSLVTYVAALKACSGLATQKGERQLALERGMAIHEQIKKRSLDSHLIVASSLVDMYCKCGNMLVARDVFDRMSCKTTVTWTCLLFGYFTNGECRKALELYESMDCEPDHVTYIAAVKACTGIASETPLGHGNSTLEKGIAIHKRSTILVPDVYLSSALVELYSQCGHMKLARETFDRMSRRDAAAWNCLMQGYVKNGQSVLALDLFQCMDIAPNHASCVTALRACSALGSQGMEKVQAVHERIRKLDFETELTIASSLVDTYCKLGNIELARVAFERASRKDIVIWTCLVLGYVNIGENLVALEMFDCMDCKPDQVMYTAALRACAGIASCSDSHKKQMASEKGMLIHERIKENGLELCLAIAHALMRFYSACGNMVLSRNVFERIEFKNVIAWTCLIMGYADNGDPKNALHLFGIMDVEPDEITYIAALKACTALASVGEKDLGLRIGTDVHNRVKERSFDLNTGIATMLVNMYRKCGDMSLARKVYENLAFDKDVVIWTSLILGYLENGECKLALELFLQMDCEPDPYTYAVALKACGSLVLLPHGRWIHAMVCKRGLEQDAGIANTLIDFYGRCGCPKLGVEMFHSIQSPDILSWNALTAVYSALGDFVQVFNLAAEIREAGLQLNSCTFLYILAACSHGGAVQQGKMAFDSMCDLDIAHTMEHYTCMVDMFCRANRFEEANMLLMNMPLQADGVAWKTLLAACKKWGNFKFAKLSFDRILSRDEGENMAAAYVLMGDVYKAQV